jgi:diguanylate cyclase (GGDEF)-like protein
VHRDDAAAYHDAWHYETLLDRDGDIVQTEYRLVGYDGAFRWVRDRWLVTLRDGRLFMTGAVRDISAQRAAEAQRAAIVGQLEHLSTVDPLTELFNRRHLGAVLRERLARPEARIAVAMVDVDHFKAINDQHGHAVGDHVLKTVARRLRLATRRDDVIARWGGEEFCVLLSDVTDDAQLIALAERLRLSIQSNPIGVGGMTHLAVSVSVGAARILHAGARPEELLATADAALYRAKDAGRNRTIIAQLEGSPALRVDAAQTA